MAGSGSPASVLRRRLMRGSALLLAMEQAGSAGSSEYARLLAHFTSLLEEYESAFWDAHVRARGQGCQAEAQATGQRSL